MANVQPEATSGIQYEGLSAEVSESHIWDICLCLYRLNGKKNLVSNTSSALVCHLDATTLPVNAKDRLIIS